MGSFKILLLIIATLLILEIAGAEEFSSLDISPPELPGSAESLDKFEVTFFLEDQNMQNLSNLHINIELTSANYSRKNLYFANQNFLVIYIPRGSYEIVIKADSLETSGGDFYYKGELEADNDQEQTISFWPAGSLRGVVYIDGAIAQNALLKFVCGKQYGELGEQETDQFGSFSNDYLPVGSCKIYARLGNRIGFSDATIQKGEISNIELVLDKNAGSSNIIIFIVLAAAVLAVAGAFFFRQKLAKKHPAKNRRAEDLLKTFNENEKAVVGLLMKQGELYQNKIVHETGIPKTSLMRVFMSLEQKKAIEVIKIGKTKKINLSKWFLNKEKG